MLQNISWTAFLIAMSLLTIAWYTWVLLKYYPEKLAALLMSKRRRASLENGTDEEWVEFEEVKAVQQRPPASPKTPESLPPDQPDKGPLIACPVKE